MRSNSVSSRPTCPQGDCCEIEKEVKWAMPIGRKFVEPVVTKVDPKRRMGIERANTCWWIGTGAAEGGCFVDV